MSSLEHGSFFFIRVAIEVSRKFGQGVKLIHPKTLRVVNILTVPLAGILIVHIRFMYLPDDISPKLLADFGTVTLDENFRE